MAAPTILIIEDQEDIASLTALILRDEGYHVLIAGSGEEGLRLLAEITIDLLLLDIMLPGIDGWEVCRRIRAYAHLAPFPIYAFTVRTAKTDENRPEGAYLDGVIAKPFFREELITAVQTALADHAGAKS